MMAATFKRDTLKGRIARRAIAKQRVAEDVGAIERGCEIYGLTSGDWSLIDLIEHTLSATGPASLSFVTWTVAPADIGFLREFSAKGLARSCRFVLDWSFLSRQAGYLDGLRKSFGDEAIRITKTHAKLALIKNDRWNVVIRSSMNLNENRRSESYEISESGPMASYLCGVFDELFAKQLAKEAFSFSHALHMDSFESQWEVGGASKNPVALAMPTAGPFDRDPSRSGLQFSRQGGAM